MQVVPPRPHYQFPRHTATGIALAILIFSILVNVNKFFEYRTETLDLEMPDTHVVIGAVKTAEANGMVSDKSGYYSTSQSFNAVRRNSFNEVYCSLCDGPLHR